jgi:hypothetical protein
MRGSERPLPNSWFLEMIEMELPTLPIIWFSRRLDTASEEHRNQKAR